IISEENCKSIQQAYEERVFQPSDKVLKRIIPSHLLDLREKFRPVWEGPFIVKEVMSRGALRLVNAKGEELPKPINSDYIKAYFC
ncbi:hypothetical protein DVA76_18500, partial [Acinetobacter baumannii]